MSDFDTPITSLSPKRHRAAIAQLVNQERAGHGLPALRAARSLELSARAWAFVLSREGRVDHGDFRRRALRFPFVVAGTPRNRRSVGENIGFGAGTSSTPREVVRDWMRSPGHRANIMRRWQYGAVWSSRSDDAVTVVQHFGRNNR